MAKKFVYITQTHHLVVIMDIDENETYDDIQARILNYVIKTGNGEARNVINFGGYIKHEIMDVGREVDEEDEKDYECIK